MVVVFHAVAWLLLDCCTASICLREWPWLENRSDVALNRAILLTNGEQHRYSDNANPFHNARAELIVA